VVASVPLPGEVCAHGTLICATPFVAGSLRPGTVTVFTVVSTLFTDLLMVTVAGCVDRLAITNANSLSAVP